MKTKLLVFITIGMATFQGRGEITSAPPGGYVKVEIEGRSENVIAVPLRKRGTYTGRVVAVSSNKLSFAQTNWATNEFNATSNGKPRFYLEVITGDLAGIFFPIVSNSADTLTLEVGGKDLSAPLAGLGLLNVDTYEEAPNPPGTYALGTKGDTVRIRPVWTLGEFLGANGDLLDEFEDAEAAALYNGGDRVFIPAEEGVGFRKPPKPILTYLASAGWRDIADINADQGDTAMLPGKPLIVHRNAKEGTELVVVGYPKLDRSVLWVPGSSVNSPNLAYTASVFSEPLSLDESGLSNSTSATIEASPSLSEVGDELFLYDGSRGGLFPVAGKRFIYLSGSGWRERGSNLATIGTDETLLPGRGFGILKRSGKNGGYWISSPDYLVSE